MFEANPEDFLDQKRRVSSAKPRSWEAKQAPERLSIADIHAGAKCDAEFFRSLGRQRAEKYGSY